MKIGIGEFLQGDCLELMKDIPDGSVDMILCDLPYGTTGNYWDEIIPFEPLWEQYWRIAKENAAVVLTAQPPFDKILGASQIKYLKYEWIWEKNIMTGFLNAKKQPLKQHENCLVFYRKQCKYNPQKTQGTPYKSCSSGKNKLSSNYSKPGSDDLNTGGHGSPDGSRYPKSIQKFNRDQGGIHPTQKPVSMFEYFVKTYTDEGEVVLDNCAGSGTTAVACENTKRKWICMEQDKEYFEKATKRVQGVVNNQTYEIF